MWINSSPHSSDKVTDFPLNPVTVDAEDIPNVSCSMVVIERGTFRFTRSNEFTAQGTAAALPFEQG